MRKDYRNSERKGSASANHQIIARNVFSGDYTERSGLSKMSGNTGAINDDAGFSFGNEDSGEAPWKTHRLDCHSDKKFSILSGFFSDNRRALCESLKKPLVIENC